MVLVCLIIFHLFGITCVCIVRRDPQSKLLTTAPLVPLFCAVITRLKGPAEEVDMSIFTYSFLSPVLFWIHMHFVFLPFDIVYETGFIGVIS